MSAEGVTAPQTIYTIPDLHGCLPQLRNALDAIPLDDPAVMLVFLGDYIDRGPDSAGVLYAVKELAEQHRGRVVTLLGNHERWFLDWLDGDEDDIMWLTSDQGLVTVRSFLGEEITDRFFDDLVAAGGDAEAMMRVNAAVRQAIRERHAEAIAWLRRCPLVYETEDQIYVHAGIDEEAGPDWRWMTPDHVLTEKYPPTFGPFYKMIIAGHVATYGIHRDGTYRPFLDAGHCYLDGSVEFSGQLNVLHYDTRTKEYGYFSVKGH